MLKKFLRLIIIAFGVFSFLPASAQYGLTKPSGMVDTNIPNFIGKSLGSILGFTGIIFFVLVVYGGLLWMTSAGNEDSVAKAKKILTAAIIGLIIVMSAYAITRFIGSSIG